jgi:hypothetical protein
MRRKIIFKVAMLILGFVAAATAHPLGNFTINQYSRIEVESSQVKLRSFWIWRNSDFSGIAND